jgi:hypothetical protein
MLVAAMTTIIIFLPRPIKKVKTFPPALTFWRQRVVTAIIETRRETPFCRGAAIDGRELRETARTA